MNVRLRIDDVFYHLERNSSVHIDVPAAMTGVSRFLQLRPDITYSKVENLNEEELLAMNFTYLITSKPQVQGYQEIGFAEGFSHLQAEGFRLRVVTQPLIFIWERVVDE